MKKLSLLAVVVLLLTMVMSCTTAQFSGLQMTKEIPSYQSVGTFETEVQVMEFLGSAGGANLFNVTADKMDTVVFDAIQREIAKFSGDAAVNIVITQKANFLDILLNSLTGTILAPVHIEISGTIVKYAN